MISLDTTYRYVLWRIGKDRRYHTHDILVQVYVASQQGWYQISGKDESFPSRKPWHVGVDGHVGAEETSRSHRCIGSGCCTRRS